MSKVSFKLAHVLMAITFSPYVSQTLCALALFYWWKQNKR